MNYSQKSSWFFTIRIPNIYPKHTCLTLASFNLSKGTEHDAFLGVATIVATPTEFLKLKSQLYEEITMRNIHAVQSETPWAILPHHSPSHLLEQFATEQFPGQLEDSG